MRVIHVSESVLISGGKQAFPPMDVIDFSATYVGMYTANNLLTRVSSAYPLLLGPAGTLCSAFALCVGGYIGYHFGLSWKYFFEYTD